MDTKYLFYITLIISIVVQVVTGIVDIAAVFVKVPNIYSIIRQLLILELVVQFIEGSFYVWLAYNFTKVLNVTPKRYIDWVITTPTMLITLIIYLIYLNKKIENKTGELEFFTLLKENSNVIIPVLILNWLMLLFGYLGEIRAIPVLFGVFLGFIPFLIYLNKKVENKTDELDFFTIFKDNSNVIIPVIILNWLMLLFGYLGEIRTIPVLLGVFLGFIPFLIYYYLIYVNYVTQDSNGYLLFWYFFFFWSLYGFAAVLPYNFKNSLYNILDLFAKNFFGIFLSYIIISGNY